MVRALTASLAVLLLVASPAAGQQQPTEQWAVNPQTVLDLPGAWRLSQGAGVVVAVIDSGVRIDHPDLRSNLWRNPAERPGNERDDDGNGYVDDVHGVNLSSRGDDARTCATTSGHGTHVAGTIAAAANGRGVIGVAYRAKLMTVKILDERGIGSTKAMAEGIRYAAANGARIINLSLETPDRRPARAGRDQGRAGRGRADRLLGRQHRHRHRPAAAVPGRDPGAEPDRRRRDGARRRAGAVEVLQLRLAHRAGRRARRGRRLDLPRRRLRDPLGHVDGRAARGRRRGPDGVRQPAAVRGRAARAAARARACAPRRPAARARSRRWRRCRPPCARRRTRSTRPRRPASSRSRRPRTRCARSTRSRAPRSAPCA